MDQSLEKQGLHETAQRLSFSDSDDDSYTTDSLVDEAGSDGPPQELRATQSTVIPGGAAALRFKRFVDAEMKRLADERLMYLRRIELTRYVTRRCLSRQGQHDIGSLCISSGAAQRKSMHPPWN